MLLGYGSVQSLRPVARNVRGNQEEADRRNERATRYEPEKQVGPSANAETSLLHVAGQDVAKANIAHCSWIEIGERAKDVYGLAAAQPGLKPTAMGTRQCSLSSFEEGAAVRVETVLAAMRAAVKC